jgi:hypothetical protein
MRDCDARDEAEGLRLVRDRAVILLLFAGALKRDELRTLTVENVAFAEGGIRVTVAAGDRAPRDVVILAGTDPLTDPVAALETCFASPASRPAPSCAASMPRARSARDPLTAAPSPARSRLAASALGSIPRLSRP